MARQTKKRKHKKKAKSKINRKKLLIVAASLFVILFVLLKVVQGITSGVSTASKNIGTLVTSIFGEGKDTSNVNTDKQFDLQEENNTPKKKYIVYLDVGHGGSDIGYQTESGEMEKDIDLEISKLVSSRLSSQGDISVIVSRNTDKLLSNTDRVEDANKQNADIFVSIHLNKIPQQQYDGWQTFYNAKSEDGQKLAVSIQNNLNNAIQKENNRVAKSIESVYIVKHVEIPMTIVECGFLSNPEEEKLLLEDDYQNRLAWGIYNGIINYFYK